MTDSAERPPPRFSSGQRVPDFFIVGHAKSGTTALYEMLRRHPQIHMPDAKEPWYFSTDMRSRFQPRRAGAAPETLEEYLALFAHARPDQQLQTHVETVKDLRKAIGLEALRAQGRRVPRRSHRPQLLQYSERVHYVEQLQRYREIFPPEQILTLIYDDFLSDNAATVRQVARLLGVEEREPVQEIRANPSVRMRSQQLDDVVHAVSVGSGPMSRAVKASAKLLTPERMRRDVLRFAQRRLVHGRPQPVDESLMIELQRRFKPEVLALSDYLGRDLVTLWGYDELD
jgi:sulfotransferase family protein